MNHYNAEHSVMRIRQLKQSLCRCMFSTRRLRWLFISHLYRKPLAHSETIITLMRNKDNLDESYWIGKIRQYAHIVDKGLHRGDFTKGHGITSYRAAKDALARIKTSNGLNDPLVQWATKIIFLYEHSQNGRVQRRYSEHVPTRCLYDDLVDAIKTRRSIRRYLRKKVDNTVIQMIAEVMDWAPTSCHRQPGRIYASNQPSIVSHCVNLHAGAACFTDIYVPLFMTFCADTRLYRLPDELSIPYIDVSLGIQNCLLAAHALGLSLTPLIWSYQNEWQERELRKILSIPEHFQIILSTAGGYPDGGTQVPPRKRPELFIVN